MMRVHYLPLNALRPLHVALLVALQRHPAVSEAAVALGLPRVEMECAARELEAWGLLESHAHAAQLTPRGARCAVVWRDTGGTGCWRIPDDPDWVLGPGTFYFARPLEALEEAGWNPEMGTQLSEQEALHWVEEDHKSFAASQKNAKNPALRQRLWDALQNRPVHESMLEDLLEELFAGTRTFPEMEALRRQVERALNAAHPRREARQGQRGRKTVHSNTRDWGGREARRAVERVLRKTASRIGWYQQKTEGVREVLLAAWFKRRGGILREIARTESALLTVVCEEAPRTADAGPGVQETRHAA
jgi:hypothetical protein